MRPKTRRSLGIASGLLSVLMVTACGGGDSGSEKGSDEPTSGSSTPRDGSAITAGVGDTVKIGELDGAATADMTIDEIERDAPCPTGAREAGNGEFIGVDITLKATGKQDNTGLGSLTWKAVDDTGAEIEVRPLLTMLCFPPAKQMPVKFEGRKKWSGTLLFDVTPRTTELVGQFPYRDGSPVLTIPIS